MSAALAGSAPAVDSGAKEGLTSVQKRDLVELRRKMRVLAMDKEILKRVSACFGRENVLPKIGSRLVHELNDDGSTSR